MSFEDLNSFKVRGRGAYEKERGLFHLETFKRKRGAYFIRRPFKMRRGI